MQYYKFWMEIYTRNGHVHIGGFPVYAFGVPGAELDIIYQKYSAFTPIYASTTFGLVDFFGSLDAPAIEMIRDGISAYNYAYCESILPVKNEQMEKDLAVSTYSMRKVFPNRHDVSRVFHSVSTFEGEGQVDLAWSVDGGATIVDDGFVRWSERYKTFSVNMPGVNVIGRSGDFVRFDAQIIFFPTDGHVSTKHCQINASSGTYQKWTRYNAWYSLGRQTWPNYFYDAIDHAELIDPGDEDDPYPEEPSEPGGGEGDDDQPDTPVPVPPLPDLSAVDSGFISLWSPTNKQMLDLASFLWNANPLTIDFWRKIVGDPMQLIYGLAIVPLDLHEMDLIDGTDTVVVGLINTGIQMDHIATQWVELDCGYIDIDERWGAYLDYDPYTKLEIFLPYCGAHPLKVDDIMPGRLTLKYHIDLLSGACVAILVSTKSDKHGDTLNSVMYQFMGNLASQVPVTAAQYADAVRSVISLAASIGAMVATGGSAAASMAAAAGANNAAALQTSIATQLVANEIRTGAAAVENVMGIKPSIERSGAIGSTGGLLGVQKPYLIFTRPRQARPAGQNRYTGYPSFITEDLSTLTGWTQIQAIHLEGIPCTSEELSEIESLLKSGVIM